MYNRLNILICVTKNCNKLLLNFPFLVLNYYSKDPEHCCNEDEDNSLQTSKLTKFAILPITFQNIVLQDMEDCLNIILNGLCFSLYTILCQKSNETTSLKRMFMLPYVFVHVTI